MLLPRFQRPEGNPCEKSTARREPSESSKVGTGKQDFLMCPRERVVWLVRPTFELR